MSHGPGPRPGPDRSTGRLPLVAWREPLYCHAPAGEPFDPAALAEPGDHGDRWSRPGEPTAYLASEPAVALAELARHHRPGVRRFERRILRVHPAGAGLEGLVDLRDPAVRGAIVGAGTLDAFLDRELARAAADRVRGDSRHAGLIVPSMAFLDDPHRCNVVLFADRVGDLVARLGAAAEVASLVIEGA